MKDSLNMRVWGPVALLIFAIGCSDSTEDKVPASVDASSPPPGLGDISPTNKTSGSGGVPSLSTRLVGLNPRAADSGQKDTPTFTKGLAPIKTGIKNIDDVDFAWKSTFPKGVLIDKRTSVKKRRIGSQAMNVHVRQSLVRVEGEKNPLISSEETFVQDEDTGEFTSAGVENSSANQLLVSTNSAESSAGVQSAHSTEPLGGGMLVVNLGDNATLDSRNQAAARLRAMPGVQHVEPNYILTVKSTTPNDPSYDKLWGMHNSSDTDIDAPQAWDIGTGTGEILVGVIDSGFDYTHEDLKANAWTNPGESGLDADGKDKTTNGVDDDGNGYIDDYKGWDWVNNDNDPMDDNNHGTHCAGTIGGVGNNGIGVAGVSWKVKIVGLKFLSGSGSGNTADAIKAVKYATKIGVDLTSNSWGGGGSSELMKTAIEEANDAGIMFIAAAGNDSKDNDLVPSYPAGYDVANVISVASTQSDGVLSSFSNYGATSVDIAAPGSDIYSTIPGNNYASYSGTSMATPAVSGAVALMLSENPALTASEIRSQLLNSGRKMESLEGKLVTEAQMNVNNMLSSLSGSPGEMESPEAGSTVSGDSEIFYWTKGRFVTDFKLKIGSTAGASDIYESDSLGTVTSQAVDNLPVDDRDLYVTLSSQTEDGWQNRTYQYASWGPNAKAVAAELLKPVEDTVLNEGETYEFSWTAGSGLDQKWLKVGSEAHQGDYFDEQVDGSTKKDLTFDLFKNEKVYVTLESQDPYQQWTKKQYEFDVTLSQQSRITSPTPESTVGPGETKFTWRKGDNVLGHWLTVKDARGPTTYFDGLIAPGEDSKSVDIPASGRRIEATLGSIILNLEELTPEAILAGDWKKDHKVYYLSPKP